MDLNHCNAVLMGNVLANKVSLETNAMNAVQDIKEKTVIPVRLDTSTTHVKVS